MEVIVIGHWGGYPRENEASSGYLIEYNGFKLLLDCGSAVLSKLQSYIQPKQLDALILSHYHPDHVADIGVLQHALLIEKYINNTENCLEIYGHTLDIEGFKLLTYKDVTKGLAYSGDESIQIGPFELEFIKTVHPAPCYAMRLTAGGKSLVYTADTAYFDELVDFSHQADLLLCEANFYKGMDGGAAGHMTSAEAGKLAAKANVGKLILTHLPHFGDHQQLLEEAGEAYSGPIQLASQGLQLII